MRNRFRSLQETFGSSYWFLPSIMAILAVALSIITIQLDERIGRQIGWLTGLVYVDSPEGARAVLSTVASSMITVAGVVFSLTMVVLSLNSQQYGPLVLAHFMRDRANQFVLGVFTATYIYCLLVLRTIRGQENDVFVPHLSVLFGLGLSIASLAVLIYFIHHIAQSIQGPNIIARLSYDLMEMIDTLFPTTLGKEIPSGEEQMPPPLEAQFEQEGFPIKTRESGYLQMIDDSGLLEIAREFDVVVSLEVYPGRFLFKGQTVAHILPKERGSDSLSNAVRNTFILGSRRTPAQDIEFIITQLSALAVRALSPALNDPYTAMLVIDRLGEALCALLERQQPSIYRYDDDSKLRVIADPITFESLFHSAFDQIRHYGHSDLKVDVRLLEVLGVLWECTTYPPHRRLLQRYAAMLYGEGQDRLTTSEDQRLGHIYRALAQEYGW